MGGSFFEQPILNSPYEAPRLHHALDEHGQPLDVPPVEGRRRSEIITPVPMPRMQTGRTSQGSLPLATGMIALSGAGIQPNPDHQRNPHACRELARAARTRPTGASRRRRRGC